MPKVSESAAIEWELKHVHAQRALAVRHYDGGKSFETVARELGITPPTLLKWRNLPGFQLEVARYADEAFAEHDPAVLAAVASRAINGTAADARLYLELRGKVEGKAVHVGVNVHTNGHDKTVAERLRELAAGNGNRRGVA